MPPDAAPDLDLLVAQHVLGYATFPGRLVRFHPDGPLRPCPAYSRDHNATADAERHVLTAGLGETSAHHLLSVVRDELGGRSSWMVWLSATPPQRCQALLRAVRS